MNTVTHALIPALAAGIFVQAYKGGNRAHAQLSNQHILLISLLGAAPDLLNPHLSLDARYSSWSHSIFAWLGISIILVLLRLRWGKWLNLQTTIWCCAAYGLHLVCDAIAGGIAWLHPWKSDILGAYYVPPVLWIPIDVFCFLAAYFLFRVIPRFGQIKSRPNNRSTFNKSL